MTTIHHAIHRFALTIACCAALAACGGGGSSSDASTTPATANSFSTLQGSYAIACDGRIDTSGLNPSQGSQATIVVGDLVGADKVNVSLRTLGYTTPKGDPRGGSCDPATLTGDLTVTAQIRDLGASKNYVNAAGATVSVKLVELSYVGLTLSKGTLSGLTIPMAGATTKVGYLLDGNKLYALKGGRGADGLGESLSPRFGVKQ